MAPETYINVKFPDGRTFKFYTGVALINDRDGTIDYYNGNGELTKVIQGAQRIKLVG